MMARARSSTGVGTPASCAHNTPKLGAACPGTSLYRNTSWSLPAPAAAVVAAVAAALPLPPLPPEAARCTCSSPSTTTLIDKKASWGLRGRYCGRSTSLRAGRVGAVKGRGRKCAAAHCLQQTSVSLQAGQRCSPDARAPEVRAQHHAGRAGQRGEVAQRGAQQAHAVGSQRALAKLVDDAEGPAFSTA